MKAGDVSRELRESCGAAADSVSLAIAMSVVETELLADRIDLADGAKGAGFGVGSPLAVALAFRDSAGWWLGRPRTPSFVR